MRDCTVASIPIPVSITRTTTASWPIQRTRDEAHRERDGARRSLERIPPIGHQIDDHLIEAIGVGPHEQGECRELHGEGAALAGLPYQVLAQRYQSRHDVEQLRTYLLAPSDGEQLLRQPRGALGRALDFDQFRIDRRGRADLCADFPHVP